MTEFRYTEPLLFTLGVELSSVQYTKKFMYASLGIVDFIYLLSSEQEYFFILLSADVVRPPRKAFRLLYNDSNLSVGQARISLMCQKQLAELYNKCFS